MKIIISVQTCTNNFFSLQHSETIPKIKCDLKKAYFLSFLIFFLGSMWMRAHTYTYMDVCTRNFLGIPVSLSGTSDQL